MGCNIAVIVDIGAINHFRDCEFDHTRSIATHNSTKRDLFKTHTLTNLLHTNKQNNKTKVKENRGKIAC